MKLGCKKFVAWMLVFLHVLIIFSFSRQDASASSALSEGLTEKIKSQQTIEEEILAKEGEQAEQNVVLQAEEKFSSLESILRKCAHMFLFFVLGILICLLVKLYGLEKVYAKTTVIFSGIAVAFFDETIQLYTHGRSGEFKDVLIDTLGLCIGILIFTIGELLYEKKRGTKMAG